MRTATITGLLCVLFAAALAWSQETSRTLLEKKLYYVTDQGKLGETSYWSLSLGSQQCKLRRKFPGEDTMMIDAAMNLSLISSGYISGSGITDKGKVDCLTGFMVVTPDSTVKIALDSIDYAWDNLDRVAVRSGPTGDLRVNLEGTPVVPKHLLLTAFKMVAYYGEKVLRKDCDVTVVAFSFTKDGIKKAQAAMGIKPAAGKK
jgi:hypothetical protein